MVANNTSIFWKNMDHINSAGMSPGRIIEFLEQGAIYRTFADVLASVYPGEDLKERLNRGLGEIQGIAPGSKGAESLDRNIRNWLRGRSTPQNREDLFQICFALGLGEAASSKVLASASETGIHYRNPRELVYAFCLRTGRSYGEAAALHEKLDARFGPQIQTAAKEKAQAWDAWEKTCREARKKAREEYRKAIKMGRRPDPFLGEAEEPVPNFLTQQVIHRFESVGTAEELEQFFRENCASLGTIHESAYEKFRLLLMTLAQPNDWMAGEEDPEETFQEEGAYSLEKIMEVYLRMNVPLGKKTRDYSYLQKTIKRSWPDASSLQKMRARKMDVDRKTLLLLFIATEDHLFSRDLEYAQVEEDAFDYEMDTDLDDLEVTISKLDMFLTIYGMNRLDPGNPFDCLVLYALAAEYGSETLGDPFSEALEVLFRDVEHT